MSAAASTSASPTVVRSHSSSRPHAHHRPPSSDLPHRTRSTTARPPSSYSHQHTSSRSQSYDRRPPSNQAAFANIARRDFENSNLARPSTSRRDSSRERSQERPLTSHRPDPARAPQHHSTASRQRRNSVDMPGTVVDANTANVAAATASAQQAGHGNPAQPKRRTMISTPTGQWALGKTIGAGSMGKVKIAKNIETGEQVAVKVVPRQTTEEHRSGRDAERADRSKEIRTAREAAIVSLVDHPYVCGMRDVVRTPYHWYMLFEYVNGGQMLDYIISHGKLKEKQARKFARQIASALDYCHRNSIVHRDLKIENILISKTGDIKIIDFGLSNLFSPRSHLRTFCGSLYFAAPELLQARQYTGPEVDVWSFGIVLYVLVCGKVPFDDQSMPNLHAKIKKGEVEYPQGLTSECRHIISRMLVTDPKKRASLAEIMNHPWMTKGFNGPPENYLPVREPLQLPLDPEVVEKMTGFDFGPPEFITAQLTKTLESEDYQIAARSFTRESATPNPSSDKRRGVFDFYRRRNSASRETLSNPSVEAVQTGSDPLNAYSPLISVYFLVKEKLDRERASKNPGALSIPSDTVLKMPDLATPETAHTNQYDVPGVKDTSSRSRPRARTHGDDDLTDGIKKLHVNQSASPNPNPTIVTPQSDSPAKKESTAAGILRRFSTRRVRDRGRESGEREKHSAQTVPSLNVQPPADMASTPHRGFSIRRTRRAEPSPTTLHASDSQTHQDPLQPPRSAGGPLQETRSNKYLERSTSVNSADYRSRRLARKYGADGNGSNLNEPPLTSGSDGLGGSDVDRQKPSLGESAPLNEAKTASRTGAMRAKSLGHARRESIQARRARREEAREATVPEDEDDGDLSNTGNALETPNTGEDFAKPVYLKGLFSVSTTSSKPLPFIRADIIRVLRQLNVEYTEIKGGFSCRHAPSIDLDRVVDARPSSPERQGQVSAHKRRISFGGLRANEEAREETRATHSSRYNRRNQGPPDRSFISNSEASDDYGQSQNNVVGERVVGETTTRVQSDTGENLVLRFEILIVKVPLFSLHGIQFKKVSGGMWQYREMAKRILDALRL
ncbi:Protein kinase kin1 [Talaromyces pinophilus]|nr:Protein kinase kin1 [Talaromyces pinophilus]